jgi:hypothetical protein
MKTVLILLALINPCHGGKIFQPKEKILFEEDPYTPVKKWTYLGTDETESIKQLIGILTKSPIGERILALAKKKAMEFGKSLDEIIISGEKSFTDSTLIRKFSTENNSEIIYESRSMIQLDRNLGPKEALLDLAHELTHFSLRRQFNPYDEKFNAKDFIISTVEGKGGEVEAFLVECTVFRETFSKEEFQKSKCNKLLDPGTGKISKQKGIEHFYRIGEHLSNFQQELQKMGISKEDFPYLTDETATFYSSTYGLPYPIAAMREYQMIQKKVCQNNFNRSQYFKKSKTKNEEVSDENLRSKCDHISFTPFVDLNQASR